MLWFNDNNAWEKVGISLFWDKESWVHNMNCPLNRKWRQFYLLDPNYADYFRNIAWSICTSLLITFFTKIESWSFIPLLLLFMSFICFTLTAFHWTSVSNFIKKQQARFSDLKLIARGKNNFRELKLKNEEDFQKSHVDIRHAKRTNQSVEYPHFLSFGDYMDNITMDDEVKKKLYPLRLKYSKVFCILGTCLLALSCIVVGSEHIDINTSVLAQISFNIILSACFYLLVALSFTYIFSTTKVFHLAHAAVILVGGYIFFQLKILNGMSVFPSLIISILSSVLLGLICEIGVYRPMRNNRSGSLSAMIASLGIYVIVQNAIVLIYGNETQLIEISSIERTINLLGAHVNIIEIISITTCVLSFILLGFLGKKTILGKSIRALSMNEELGGIYGISSNRIIAVVFILSSTLAGLIGILSALDTGLSSSFGFDLLLYGVVVMIIGGDGNIIGLIVGSLLLAAVQHLAAFYIDTKWMDAAAYVILIVFLILRPYGFLGTPIKKAQI